ncbi:3-phosphoshikimate 1-carboxyvinyltransferase [Kangiella sp. TOML190]|uniref:3-phosphoshikimate 1-carboxyvinyltransferase n=1 Tax=Kangiella sp. TOML190 TaxID=2931351 RepID=UPI00203FC859|nr:3-phosphoshikimate 1-carboxyvinyltransferase [Kangiella sp. TOML190]
MAKRKIIKNNLGFSPDQPLRVKVPGSKYLANRYLVIAALCDGETQLTNVPMNDDIKASLVAIEALGAEVKVTPDIIGITGIKNYQPEKNILINCRDSGTLSRFVTALAATLASPVTIDASQQMRQRPMQEIIDSLTSLQVKLESNEGYLPLQVQGPIKGGICQLDASRSSQFLSALLIACLKSEEDSRIQVTGDLVSQSYVELTLAAIQKFSGQIQQPNATEYFIPKHQDLTAPCIEVASDVVSCSYFMAAALIAKTSIRIEAYDFDSPQGEAQFPTVLEKMGAKVERLDEELVISYQDDLHGIDVDMGNMPDAVPTLTVIAAFAQGETRISNIAHLAFKESNRIVDLCEQLKKLGVNCQYDKDSIRIYGGAKLTAADVSSCHDHRLAMSLALVGVQIPGIVIEDSQAVEKSFPQYWQYLEQIGIVTEEIQ